MRVNNLCINSECIMVLGNNGNNFNYALTEDNHGNLHIDILSPKTAKKIKEQFRETYQLLKKLGR